MKRWRVGVNLCWVGSTTDADAVTAVFDALGAIAAEPPDDLDLVLFGLASLQEEHGRLLEAFEHHVLPVPDSVGVVRVGAEHAWLRAAEARHHVDVVHDAGGTSPGSTRLPHVVSVDDLVAIERPRGVHPLRVAHRWRGVPRAVAGARRVIVPSEFVRSRLVERLGTAEDKITVVPWPLPRHEEAAQIDNVRVEFGILGPIVLLAAATDAHEEHVVAIRALEHLASRHEDVTLVLTGPEGAIERRVLEEIESRDLRSRVVRTGEVSPAVQSALIEGAVAVIHPAVYGGFPSRVLEAMASGVPVIVAAAGAGPEVVGDAGAVVPPGDDVQLAVEVHRLVEDAEWRSRMIARGLERAAGYTPARTAEGLLAAYRSVIDGL